KSKLCRDDGISPKDGFRCGEKFIKFSKVMKSAKKACSRIESNKDRTLPALYTGPGFNWQSETLFESNIYSKLWNLGFRQKYRVVISRRCVVVGTAVRNKDASYTPCTFGPKSGRKY
ncbi:hypothetical protein Golomagni_06708, partial [Golovinomyces magnicellulatus]